MVTSSSNGIPLDRNMFLTIPFKYSTLSFHSLYDDGRENFVSNFGAFGSAEYSLGLALSIFSILWTSFVTVLTVSLLFGELFVEFSEEFFVPVFASEISHLLQRRFLLPLSLNCLIDTDVRSPQRVHVNSAELDLENRTVFFLHMSITSSIVFISMFLPCLYYFLFLLFCQEILCHEKNLP